MATHPPNQPTRRAPQQQVFRPRESVIKLTRFFPLVISGVVAMLGVGIAVGFYMNAWLIPLMMAVPLFSTVVGATIASRMSKSRVEIDQVGLRLLSGDTLQAHIPWNHITRLTVRQERGDNVYEVWVKSRVVPLQAAYYENGDQLLAAVSTRTNRPWERLREPKR